MPILHVKKAQQGLKSKLIEEAGKGPKNKKKVLAVGKAYTNKRWKDISKTKKDNISSMTKRSKNLKAADAKNPTFASQATTKIIDKKIAGKKKRLKQVSSYTKK